MLCDLHTHSIFSDGTFTPAEIVKEAEKIGLGAVALCDHNTTNGLKDFLSAGKHSSVITVPGIEFSTSYDEREVHLVGLFIDEEHFEKINSYCEKFHILKEESNKVLVARLCENGYIIDLEELKKKSGTTNINRAHIAAELVRKGYCESIKEAFKTLLSRSYGFYEPPQKCDIFDALSLLNETKTVSVLAHPLLNFKPNELEEFLPKAKEAGLDAIETRYSLFSPEDEKICSCFAEKFSLLQSGGSDFHAANKPDIRLGAGKGYLAVPFEFYEKLLQCKESK
ncbi:MAG: PHP domain-containing protein [Acutalibacteraceae bacterium]